jgi:perosamine synthetase
MTRVVRGLRRHPALLGGTTSLGDAVTALGHAAGLRPPLAGPAIRRYEDEFARRVGVRHALSFASGRVGLYFLLQALGVGRGDEVLLQVPTHIVVANAVRFVGARPVYVDCRLGDYNMDIAEAERRITPATKVLLLQHTFGMPADLDAALRLVERYDLALIEDCVHALGASYRGRPVGSFGRAAFFSTEETKTISSTMGGMVATDDEALAGRLERYQSECPWPSPRLVRRYMIKLVAYYVLTEPHLHRYARALYEAVGRRQPLPRPTTQDELLGRRPPDYEQRLSNAQAAVALRQLRRLDRNLDARRRLAEVCERLLAQRGFSPALPADGADPVFVRYPVWVEDRDAAVRATARVAVLGTWFTSVLEEAVSPQHGAYEPASCPVAERAARHLVNLPTHPRVRPTDIEAIVRALHGARPGAVEHREVSRSGGRAAPRAGG